MSKSKNIGVVVWVTGLSASGKTTVSKHLVGLLTEYQPTILLDGDELRSALGVVGNYSKEQRVELAKNYFKLAKLLSNQGFIVVVAALAMFNEIYAWNRENQDNYVEVFLNYPVDELFKRDPKGLYARFRNGIEKNVAGLDLKVDTPDDPDLIFSNDQNLVAEEIALRVSETVIARYQLKRSVSM
jgi:adenylylsulfate kinase-like enzyme